MAVNWLDIRNDYINGGGSYRKLAEKYGVSFSALEKRARAENWRNQKEKQCEEIAKKVRQQTADVIAKSEVKRMERMLSINDMLLDKIERAVTELDLAQVTNKKKVKVIEYKNYDRPDKPTKEIITENEEILAVASIVDRKGLQQIATALKAIWDIAVESKDGDDDEIEDDGLMDVLGKIAGNIFDDGDDSGMLPKEKEE